MYVGFYKYESKELLPFTYGSYVDFHLFSPCRIIFIIVIIIIVIIMCRIITTQKTLKTMARAVSDVTTGDNDHIS